MNGQRSVKSFSERTYHVPGYLSMPGSTGLKGVVRGYTGSPRVCMPLLVNRLGVAVSGFSGQGCLG